jgi:predicted metal-dependent hydrolase
MSIPYELIRSRRRTIALVIEVKTAAQTPMLVVRAPLATPQRHIERLIERKAVWIRKAMVRMKNREDRIPLAASLTATEIARYKREAKRLLPERVAHYAGRFNIRVASIRITSAARRWGSCNPRASHGPRINFSWRLAMAPLWIVDSVVVHELAHIAHPNHSRAFWADVRRMYPRSDEARRWLKGID